MNLINSLNNLDPSWDRIFEIWKNSKEFSCISSFLQQEALNTSVFPEDPFTVFKGINLSNIRVVILGQDPYHGEGQAHGLAFSVKKNVKVPPSLRNIFKEISRTENATFNTGCLDGWQQQGVFLLNTTLSVSKGKPLSHAKLGWETLTDLVIKEIANNASQSGNKIAFLLWGAHAQSKCHLIPDLPTILTLKSNHPSPFSALRPPFPFIGSGHFKLLREFGILVDWSIN